MFAKLAAILLGLGLTSGALLVNRQHRIDVAIETARTGDRLRREEASLGLMQSEVAAAVRPDRLAKRLAKDLDAPLQPGKDEAVAWRWIAIRGRFEPMPSFAEGGSAAR